MYLSAKICGEGSGLGIALLGYIVRLDGCKVVPAGLGKAGGGILLPQDDPWMGMCV